MGKRKTKTSKNETDDQTTHEYDKLVHRIEPFIDFYKIMLPHLLKTPSEVKTFRDILELPLPPCFRLNSTVPNFKMIQKQIDEFSKMCVEEITKIETDEKAENKQKSITNVEWVN